MTARGTYLATFRTYWERGGFLILLGAAVFVPLGLLDALANHFAEVDVGGASGITTLGALALVTGLLVQSVTSLLGEVFYAGAVALALAGGEAGKRPSFMDVARRLAYWRLIAVDLLFVAGTAVGLVLLVVPALIFVTWFGLAGPIVELEGTGVRAAFARSRRLVRGHFWTVFVVLVPIPLVSEALAEGVLAGVHNIIGVPILSDWAGEAIANIIISPIYAVAAVLLTLGLSGRRLPAGAE